MSPEDVKLWLFTLCTTLFALCSMHFAPYSSLSALRLLPSALCSLPYATRSLPLRSFQAFFLLGNALHQRIKRFGKGHHAVILELPGNCI